MKKNIFLLCIVLLILLPVVVLFNLLPVAYACYVRPQDPPDKCEDLGCKKQTDPPWGNEWIICGGGNDPPPEQPPPCVPSCGECGADGCGGTCTDTCGVFKSACSSSKTCEYYPASLTASVTTPCISSQANSKQFTVSGRNQYCGDLTMTVNYPGQTSSFVVTGSTYSDYTYSHVFTIPSDVKLPPSQLITIDVRGNRNSIKNSKDEPNYACDKTLTLDLRYLNFYYCPDPTESINQNTFDFYNNPSYFKFYGGNTQYEWDECASNQATTLCASQPTNCIANNGAQYAPNTAVNGDQDTETEVCNSKNDIQGGWLDADVNSSVCSLITGSKWFSCSNPAQCANGKDDFDNSISTGLCCGDDSGENVRNTKSKLNGLYIKNNNGSDKVYSACCLGGQTCVDEFGNCKASGAAYCVSQGGYSATCTGGEWLITADDTCQSGCEVCDINDDNEINEIDITAIDNHKLPAPYDAAYDVNHDGKVDNSDVQFCNNLNQVQCYSCGDNVLQPEDSCDLVNGNTQFNCVGYYCSENQNNYTKYNRLNTCTTGFCTCEYETTPVCDKNACGGCETNNDCSAKQVCNTNSCGCVDYVSGKELSVHIYDASCSYRFCVSGDSVSSHRVKGYIKTDTNFSSYSTEKFDTNDNLIAQTNSRLDFDINVKEDESCIIFNSAGKVDTNFTYDGAKPSLATIYFEPSEKHPAAIPFEFSTPVTNTCRLCMPTQDVETNLTDGLDNDCDGLVDEPSLEGNYGVYIWEANCNYFMCVSSTESVEHSTSGVISGNSSLYNLRKEDWDVNDGYTLGTGNKTLSFTSQLYTGQDCLIYSNDQLVSYNLDLAGSNDIGKIYLGNAETTPLTMPFQYGSPECALSCATPANCGSSSSIGTVGCGYEYCIFDCGGYWVDQSSVWDPLFGSQNPGDYCVACDPETICSDYTNKESCHFNPCDGAESYFGCSWNTTAKTCEDALDECTPGTTLCSDGTCSTDCDGTGGNADCIGIANGACEVGEGCACSDCLNQTSSCTTGAVCGEDEYCGCPADTTLCGDGACDITCENNGNKTECIGIANGVCEFGEGCACLDCDFKQDSCVAGAICNYDLNELCYNVEIGECNPGETLCNDLTCDATCQNNSGKADCIGIANGVCEVGEGCACSDCNDKRDSCAIGAACNYGIELCETVSNETCVDNDNDGYYAPAGCTIGNDCNDYSASANPDALEICGNGLDDNCNGQKEEGCSSGVDIIITSQDSIRIFDSIDVKAVVKNNLDKALDASINIDMPSLLVDKTKISVSLSAGESKEVSFKVYVLDPKVTPTITVTSGTASATTKLDYRVDVPDFIVAPSLKDIDNNKKCINFYYLIKNQGEYDMEVNIVNPNSFFSKTLIVDYVSNINVDKTAIYEAETPYCLGSRDFEVRGHLYRATPGVIVDTKAETSNKLADFRKTIGLTISVNKI